ncbi:hypothetical protein ACRYCC_30835 [Actinomadura scrupuli]|uniref:hypothetical protein n=1 Tax=Actinomadura scrupuli TaxID=559629 RepID=UPI003D994508
MHATDVIPDAGEVRVIEQPEPAAVTGSPGLRQVLEQATFLHTQSVRVLITSRRPISDAPALIKEHCCVEQVVQPSAASVP